MKKNLITMCGAHTYLQSIEKLLEKSVNSWFKKQAKQNFLCKTYST